MRLSAARYRFRESLFLLPLAIVALGVLLAELAAGADARLSGRHLAGTVTVDAGAATWLLGTVAGGTITTAGVVFSLTVVSLQLASSQFSPRVMRSFIRDRLSQVVIGVLMATFAQAVLTLRRVPGDATAAAPAVGVTTTLVLTLASVVLVVAHLDHLARRLQVGEVVRTIAAEGARVIARTAREAARERPATHVPEPGPEGCCVVRAPRDGWVTRALDHAVLGAVPAATTVRLETRTGAYVHAGEPLVTAWPDTPAVRRSVERLVAAIGVADTRTMQEDVDFALRQLVDVGLRALSPAVNDPTTAVEVVLRVGGLLRRLLVADLPGGAVAGPDGRVLLRPWDLTHDEYLAHGLDQLREAGADQVQVMAALIRVVRMLLVHVREQGRDEHVPALEARLRVLTDCVRSGRGRHPDDVAHLLAVAQAATDPAEHPAQGGAAGTVPAATSGRSGR